MLPKTLSPHLALRVMIGRNPCLDCRFRGNHPALRRAAKEKTASISCGTESRMRSFWNRVAGSASWIPARTPLIPMAAMPAIHGGTALPGHRPRCMRMNSSRTLNRSAPSRAMSISTSGRIPIATTSARPRGFSTNSSPVMSIRRHTKIPMSQTPPGFGTTSGSTIALWLPRSAMVANLSETLRTKRSLRSET